VYTDSNHRDTLIYEWPLARCSHLVVYIDGWFSELLLYSEDDIEYFIDVLVLLHVLVYRCKLNILLN
jgi:hypothetical protein